MSINPSARIRIALAAAAAVLMMGGLTSPALAQTATTPNNVTGRFDQYLNQHPDVAQQLRADPGLVDNPQFMASHPGLRDFLKTHPEVREDLKTHPYRFMNREDKLNGRQQPYSNRGAAARFDQGYLAEHPDVAQQLSANPGLVDNRQFLANHPGLADYLEDHPGIAAQLKQHPGWFMGREDHLNGWQRPEGRGALGAADSYFDHNPQVAQALNQNPKLIDDPTFLAQHPGLEDYLKAHPEARTYWRHHPYRFMRRENRYGRYH